MVVCNFYDFYQNPSDCLLTTIAIIIFINRNFTSLCTQKRRGHISQLRNYFARISLANKRHHSFN